MIRIVDIYKDIEPDNLDALGLFEIQDYNTTDHEIEEKITLAFPDMIELREKLIRMDFDRIVLEHWKIKNGYNTEDGKRL